MQSMHMDLKIILFKNIFLKVSKNLSIFGTDRRTWNFVLLIIKKSQRNC